jgi:peptide/nickel transport system permease protein
VLIFLALVAPWLTGRGYDETDLSAMSQAPSVAHPMGTDYLGRDELTRVLYGGRVSLGLAFAAAGLAAVAGAAAGLLSGYLGGWTDAGLMGLTDLGLILPLVPVVLAVGFRFGFSPFVVTLVLALLLWPPMARLVRAEVLAVRNEDYVEAARALGVPTSLIVLRHLLPGAAGVVAVEATFLVSAALLAESTLSYVSAFMCALNQNCPAAPGVQSEVYSWGKLLGQSRTTMTTQWWLTVFPGAAIALTVLCANLLGDGLRDALDPKDGG